MLEIMIALAIGTTLIIAMSNAFTVQRTAYEMNSRVTEALQAARATVDLMSREISMAGYNPTAANFTGITEHGGSNVRIRYDLNGDGNLGADPYEDVVYKYIPGTKQILRKCQPNPQWYVLAENVLDFTLTYMDGMGNVTTVEDDIRQIRISLTIETQKPVPKYGLSSITMSSSIIAQNLAYPGGVGFET